LSSFKFNYTIEQVKDCINEAEMQLRDLISTVSGENWDDNTRQALEERCNFAFKERTTAQFDMLNTYRNPLMHSRPDVLLHQKYLCLGICGEFLLAIENWRQGYTHQIKEYTVLFRFPVYPENGDENTAQLQAKQSAERWLSNVVDQLEGRLEEKSTAESEKVCLLKIREGHIKTTIRWDYPGNDDSLRRFRADPPVNSFALKIPSGTQLYQNASFRIGWFDGNPITVGLFRAQQNAEAQVCLIFQHPLGKGFYRAHELFTV
jgi:hypothetical protein